jgi:hypothetical protein
MVKIHIVVFWVMTPCCLVCYPEDGGGMFLQTIGTNLPDYGVSYLFVVYSQILSVTQTIQYCLNH